MRHTQCWPSGSRRCSGCPQRLPVFWLTKAWIAAMIRRRDRSAAEASPMYSGRPVHVKPPPTAALVSGFDQHTT